MTTRKSTRTFAYAVIDGNQAPDQCLLPESCHHTLGAARAAAEKVNSRNPNAHHYVIEWHESRWARLRPLPEHQRGL